MNYREHRHIQIELNKEELFKLEVKEKSEAIKQNKIKI